MPRDDARDIMKIILFSIFFNLSGFFVYNNTILAAELKSAKDRTHIEDQFRDQRLIENIDMTDCIIRFNRWDSATIRNMTMVRATICYNTFAYATIEGGDYSDVSIQKTHINDLHIYGANFNNCSIAGRAEATFNNGQITNTSMINAMFSAINMKTMQFKDVDLRNAIFSHINLKKASFENVDLARAVFSHSVLKDVHFKNVNLAGVIFEDVNIKGAMIYDDSINDYRPLTAADLSDAKARCIGPNWRRHRGGLAR
jgi:uncharacterized protein YjbI with pentapeptide repeats